MYLLQLLTGETLRYATANNKDGTCVDVSASGFWGGKYQKAFFDVRVFNAIQLMHLHTVVPKYPHFINILNTRNKRSMNNILGKLKWMLLPQLVF